MQIEIINHSINENKCWKHVLSLNEIYSIQEFE